MNYVTGSKMEVFLVVICRKFIINVSLTHRCWNKMDANLQTTFQNAFSWMQICILWFKFHQSLFLWVSISSDGVEHFINSLNCFKQEMILCIILVPVLTQESLQLIIQHLAKMFYSSYIIWRAGRHSLGDINPWIPENAWVHTHHSGYWCPGAKAPGHQYPQCW